MSINVTVNGSPVNIRKGKVFLVDDENLLKKEFDRRRILRLEQVRQQSKDVARKVRQKTEEEKDRQLSRFEQEQTDNLRRKKAQELASLHKKYEQCLKEIGRSHVVAATELDAEEVVEARHRKNAEQAAERNRAASEQLRQRQKEEREQAEQILRRQQCVQAVEQLRAALMRNLPPRKNKQPLTEVSLNIQPETQPGKSSTHHSAGLGKEPATCSCSTARLCECLAKFPNQASSREALPTVSNGRDKTSRSSLFALDSRVSLIPPGEEPSLEEHVRDGLVTLPQTSNVGEPLGQPSQREARVLRISGSARSAGGASRPGQGDITTRSSQRTSSGAGHSTATAATNHGSNSVGQRTAASQVDHKVQFYDYSSRFEKEAEVQYSVRRHHSIEEGAKGGAMAAARLETEQEERDRRDDREEMLARQRERSQLALTRESLRQDYQRLLQQLPALARARTARLAAVVHLGDERRRQQDTVRQSNLASVFEKLQHNMVEMDEGAAPSLHRTCVTISPQQTEDETPPKLNVGKCSTVASAGRGKDDLTAALENLRVRLEQQRALLRDEEGVLPDGVEERAVLAGEDGRPVSSASNVSRKMCKKGKPHHRRQGTLTSKENKQEGKSEGQNEEETRLEENLRNENSKSKSEDASNDKYREHTREGPSNILYKVDKQDYASKNNHRGDREREKLKVKQQEGKQDVFSKNEQENNRDILKDSNKDTKPEKRKDRHHQEHKGETIYKDVHCKSKQENNSKKQSMQRNHASKSKDRIQESDQAERQNSKIGKREYDRKEKKHKIKTNISIERSDNCKQTENSKETYQEDRQRCRSKNREVESERADKSRDSSHESSEITLVSEYSLDVSTSKRAELAQSSTNSSEQSSSNSLRVCEDIKLLLNVKEMIKSPCGTGDRQHKLKHVCKRNIDLKKCTRRKLHMVEEGTQTSLLEDKGNSSQTGDSLVEKMMLESSDSTAYLSLPRHLTEEQAEVIDQLLHVVQHKTDQVEGLLTSKETNPTLLLYIARLLSMSRASVEDLSVVSTPTPQGTPCKCLGREHDEHALPRRPPELTIPPRVARLSQAVHQAEPVVNMSSAPTSREVTQVVVQPSYKPSHTNVSSVIHRPKMSSSPTNLLLDSHTSMPVTNAATSVLHPGHDSINMCNYEDHNMSQNNDCGSSPLEVSVNIGLMKDCSSSRMGLENRLHCYSDFQTLSMEYTERISGISAQIQSLREARMQLESSSSENDHTAMSMHGFTSTPLPPEDSTTNVAAAAVAASEPGTVTWSEALGGKASSQQRGRQQRHRPPPALDRSKLMAGIEVCGPSHELSTIVEVDTPQTSHAFAATTIEQQQQQSFDSDDTLPDVAAELIRRGLISSSFWQADVTPPSEAEGQRSPSNSRGQDLESALAMLGMSWGSTTLRKVQQAEQLSSTSSEAASGTGQHSSPEDTRSRSTPFMNAPFISFPNESDVSTVHHSPESLEVQALVLGFQQAHVSDSHCKKPPRK